MFNKLKSAFSRFGKNAEDKAIEDKTPSADAVSSDKKRGVLGLVTKTKLSEDKFSELFDELE